MLSASYHIRFESLMDCIKLTELHVSLYISKPDVTLSSPQNVQTSHTLLSPSIQERWVEGRKATALLSKGETKRKRSRLQCQSVIFSGLFSPICYLVSGQPCGCLCSDINQNHPAERNIHTCDTLHNQSFIRFLLKSH